MARLGFGHAAPLLATRAFRRTPDVRITCSRASLTDVLPHREPVPKLYSALVKHFQTAPAVCVVGETFNRVCVTTKGDDYARGEMDGCLRHAGWDARNGGVGSAGCCSEGRLQDRPLVTLAPTEEATLTAALAEINAAVAKAGHAEIRYRVYKVTGKQAGNYNYMWEAAFPSGAVYDSAHQNPAFQAAI